MRGYDIDLDAVVQASLGPIVAGLAIAIVLLLVLVVVQARRIGRLARRLEGLTQGEDGGSLEAILGQHLERVNGVVRDVSRLDARTATVEHDVRTALGRVGFVRYNPFEDTGGALSFALAILDSTGAGFVVSSLHARTGTRIYAKPIEGGKSEATLSAEEIEAVSRAMATPAESPAPVARRS
jgi:hypothetical protein